MLTMKKDASCKGRRSCMGVCSLACACACARTDARIAELTTIVGLGSLRNTRVRELVGGQRKLLSVALGLVSDPSVLFLDEPTTGLDSTAAYIVVKHVADIARRGVVVVLTLHQPSMEVGHTRILTHAHAHTCSRTCTHK